MLSKTDYDNYDEDSWEKIRNKNGKYKRNKFNLTDKILEELEEDEDLND